MELLSKFKDAASMFWQSLDGQERFLIAYAGASLLVSAYARYAAIRDERIVARLREELSHG